MFRQKRTVKVTLLFGVLQNKILSNKDGTDDDGALYRIIFFSKILNL